MAAMLEDYEAAVAAVGCQGGRVDAVATTVVKAAAVTAAVCTVPQRSPGRKGSRH
jgi:hypothetical protein